MAEARVGAGFAATVRNVPLDFDEVRPAPAPRASQAWRCPGRRSAYHARQGSPPSLLQVLARVTLGQRTKRTAPRLPRAHGAAALCGHATQRPHHTPTRTRTRPKYGYHVDFRVSIPRPMVLWRICVRFVRKTGRGLFDLLYPLGVVYAVRCTSRAPRRVPPSVSRQTDPFRRRGCVRVCA